MSYPSSSKNYSNLMFVHLFHSYKMAKAERQDGSSALGQTRAVGSENLNPVSTSNAAQSKPSSHDTTQQGDLWDEAYKKLESTNKSLISQYEKALLRNIQCIYTLNMERLGVNIL